jgi:ketosteroid isomerase-like protein
MSRFFRFLSVLAVVVSGALFLIGCASVSSAEKAKLDQVEQNRAVLDKFLQYFNSGQWDKFPEVMAQDIVLHHPGGEVLKGIPAITANWKVFFGPLTNAKGTKVGEAGEGDLLVTFWWITADYKGEFMGRQIDGLPIKFMQPEMIRIENGKIVEWWVENDRQWMAEQLGASVNWK